MPREEEGGHSVVVVAGTLAGRLVTEPFIETHGAGIVGADFKVQAPRAARLRRSFGRREQTGADATAGLLLRHSDRIEPRAPTAAADEKHGVADRPPAAACATSIAGRSALRERREASTAQPIGDEAVRLDQHQSINIGGERLPDHQAGTGCGRPYDRLLAFEKRGLPRCASRIRAVLQSCAVCDPAASRLQADSCVSRNLFFRRWKASLDKADCGCRVTGLGSGQSPARRSS